MFFPEHSGIYSVKQEKISAVIFMFTTIIRTLIIYCIVAVTVRIMGKRQLGELQPGELVVTILISEIAAAPIVDPNAPLINSVVALFLLASFEILTSVINMKSVRFRFVSEGNPITVIKNGRLDQKQLKRLRFSVNDILAALRQKSIFNIEDVEYAVVETNGTLSALLKPEKRTVTVSTLNKREKDEGMPCAVVIDGHIIDHNLNDCPATISDIQRKIKNEKLEQQDIVLMTVDKNKKYFIITKKEC